MRFRLSNIVILFFFCLFLSCNNANDKGLSGDVIFNPNSASGNVDPSTLPAFKFDEETHDFGKIFEGETVSFSFKFTNSGKSDMVISDVTSSCGCTVPEWPRQAIKPGEGGIIKVTFNSAGKHGFQNKNVMIVANTQPNATPLKIKAQVITAGSQN